MGIPAFYRWLVEKYPRTVVEANEERVAMVNGAEVPVNTYLANPNGVEFDNLYLDMNGIIHPCFHPEGLPAPSSYDEIFASIFKYIDKIFSIVRPRKLLFLSIDGVAPRAKMNQQRSRRFRAAKDAAEQALLSNGCKSVLESASPEQLRKMDSNVITPGTEFMDLLSSALRYYISLRLNGDPGWQGIKVIFSDAKVPGEGEHKIMSYIRLQRNLPGFDPNTRHCLYGLDADLIMLGLAAHEIHFSILRENVQKQGMKDERRKRNKFRGGEKKNQDSKQVTEVCETLDDYIFSLNFQFFDIAILREYLAYDMRIPGLTSKPDVERMIDDFVFMCVFVGNDFLPHIPSLEISEGAIDLLMVVYKQEFVQMGGCLTNSFEINLTRVEHFIQALGSHECGIFRRRKQVQHEKERYFQRFSKGNCVSNTSKTLLPSGTGSKSSHEPGAETVCQDPQNPSTMKTDGSISIDFGSNSIVDKINLGEEGWKEWFYAEKFEAKSEDERMRIRRHAVFKYIEGICWVMRYYYDGLCSWQWFYPYHYAPFASDFHGLDQLEINFVLGEPFKPFDQLMGVLPAASAHALPLYYRKLMTDASSPILDFYPTDFELDMNGKRFSWQAICKLPFIEESRLISEIVKVEHTLTDEERERNSLGSDILSIHISHPLAATIIPFDQSNEHSKPPEAAIKLEIDPKISGGMNGYVSVSGKLEVPVKVCSPISNMEMIENNKVISVFYQCPSFHSHIPRLPDGVILPRKTVTKKDISQSHVLWHETATFGRVFLKRSIPNSIAGPHLAKLAYQLVSKHCVDDKFRKTRDIASNSFFNSSVKRLKSSAIWELFNCRNDHAVGGEEERKTGMKFNNRKKCSAVADGMGIATGANSRKRKRTQKIGSQNEGVGGHSKNDEQLDSCNHANSFQNSTHMEQKNGRVDEVLEVKTEVISRKKRRSWSKSKKRTGPDAVVLSTSAPDCSQSEGVGGHSKNDEQLDSCNHANSFQNSTHMEWKNGRADEVLEVKTEVISRKKRRSWSKSKKRTGPDAVVLSTSAPDCSQSEGVGGHSKNDEQLDSCNHANSFQNSTHMEQKNGRADEVLEVKTEVISRKKRRSWSKSKKRTGPDAVVLSTSAPDCVLKSQSEGVDGHSKNDEQLDSCNHANSFQSSTHMEQKNGRADGVLEVKTEVISRKKRRSWSKLKKRTRPDAVVLSTSAPDCFLKSQSEGVGGHSKNDEQLDSCNHANSFQNSTHMEQKNGRADEVLEVKTEVISRKKRRSWSKSKKRTGPDAVVLSTSAPDCVLKSQSEGVDGHSKNDEQLDSCNHANSFQSSTHMEQKNGRADGVLEVKTEVISRKKRRSWSKSKKRTRPDAVVLSTSAPDCFLKSQSEGVGGHSKNDEQLDSCNHANSFQNSTHMEQKNGREDGVLEVKTEVISRKKRRSWSKSKKRTGPDAVVLSTSVPDCVLKKTPTKPESGVPNIVEKFANVVPAKQEDVVQSGNLGKQGESDSQHVVGLDLTEPKKKMQRPKKRRRGEIGGVPISNNTPEKSDPVPNNVLQKSDGLVCSKQLKQRDVGDYAGEGVVESGILRKQGESDSQHAYQLESTKPGKKTHRGDRKREGNPVGGVS